LKRQPQTTNIKGPQRSSELPLEPGITGHPLGFERSVEAATSRKDRQLSSIIKDPRRPSQIVRNRIKVWSRCSD
jgi:hypothetical protein